MSDGDLLAALEEAVSLQPDNVDLRAHLAALLVGAGRATEGLEHALKALAHRPDHEAALRAADLRVEHRASQNAPRDTSGCLLRSTEVPRVLHVLKQRAISRRSSGQVTKARRMS